MIILISPSKSMNMCPINMPKRITQPEFLNEAEQLINVLSNMSIDEISKFMKISHKLAVLNHQRFKDWHIPFTSKNSKPAILSFIGDVYEGLSAESFTDSELNYAQEKLRILSGLYGILRPLDLIQPYRLEMGRSLKTKNSKNLYDFWKNQISAHIDKIDDDTVINLASNEYFKSVDHPSLSKKIITPHFKDKKNGQYKIISFYAKKARGLMSQYILKNKINTVDGLYDFDLAGYVFNSKLSSFKNPVFTRSAA